MSSIILNTALTICFVAGKSGGHLLPCMTQAKQIKQQNPQAQLYLFSSGSALDYKIASRHEYVTHITPTTLDNPPYNKPWLLPWFALKTGWYFMKSVYQLHKIKPSKVISFGGFVSIPVCLAAKILGIPFEIYELNAEPGKTTVLLSKFTDTVHTCFTATCNAFPHKKCIHFNYPVRFTKQDLIFDKQHILQQYHLQNNRMTLLILGGSQGSTLLNQGVKEMIEQNPNIAQRIQIIHQTGDSDTFNYQAFYLQHNIPAHVFGYCEKLSDFYNICDQILCRAGAGTLFEILFFNKPCITVPHETANTNHQIQNVLALQQEHPEQFKIIPQSQFNAHILKQLLSF